MNKSNSPYIMNKFVILIIPISVWNVLLEKAIKVIFNFLDSNTTYTVKVIFTFPAEEIQKKKKKHLQKPVRYLKKIFQNININPI